MIGAFLCKYSENATGSQYYDSFNHSTLSNIAL